MAADDEKMNDVDEHRYDNTEDEGEDEDTLPLVKMFINGIHNFKSLLFVWKSISPAFVFEFYRKQIISNARNSSNTILIKLTIPEEKLLDYSFRIDKLMDTSNMSEEDIDKRKVIVPVSAETFESHLRACRKNTHGIIRIWSDDTRIYFQRAGADDSSDARSERGTVIPIRAVEGDKNYINPVYTGKPITKILVNDFFESIRQAEQANSNTIKFTPYVNGIQICGHGAAGNEITYNYFGDPNKKEFVNHNEEKIKKLTKNLRKINLSKIKRGQGNNRRSIVISGSSPHAVSVPAKEIKALGRLNSVSPESSFISVYYEVSEEGNPIIMFMGNVGQFGYYQIFIRNASRDSI